MYVVRLHQRLFVYKLQHIANHLTEPYVWVDRSIKKHIFKEITSNMWTMHQETYVYELVCSNV